MFEGILDQQRALVVTPFLPLPDDAGQRKRVMQMHQLLRTAGCSITLLHYAIEHSFAWAHHGGVHAEVASMVDEIITVYPGPSFGRPPAAGDVHHLDEWWDPHLGETLQRLLAKQWFDVVVVNNVWLSKVFDYVPVGSARILETHDVFSDRSKAFQAIGQPPDFFVCGRDDEAFGWNRADIVVGISDRETRVMSNYLRRATAVELPYAEQMTAPRQATYRHPEKVTFGFIGSSHPFNVQGLHALLDTLRDVARWSPVELVVAGDVCRSLLPDQANMVVSLGYVDSPADFYDRIDIFVSPLDFGTGLKIKVVEAVSLGIPVLVTEHSAIGTALDDALIVKDVAALAEAMATIALRRPPLEGIADAVRRSQQALDKRVQAGSRQLLQAIDGHQRRTIVHYPELSLPASDARLWVMVGMLRELGNRGPVAIDLGDDADEPSWLRFLHPRVQIVGENGEREGNPLRVSRQKVPRVRLHAELAERIVFSSAADYRVEGASVHVHDARWGSRAAPAHATHVLDCDDCRSVGPSSVPMRGLPWWSDAVRWDPVLPKSSRKEDTDHVLLVVPDTDHAGMSVLVDLASHVVARPLEVMVRESGAFPSEILLHLRRSPPAVVVHVALPSGNDVLGQWCAIVGVPYVAAVTSAEVLGALREAPQPCVREFQSDWADFLGKFYL